jgi:sodium-independent sulfate anion transporter 11
MDEYLADLKANGRYRAKMYFKSLFPFLSWFPNYKIKDFLAGDLIAGFTVGLIVVPQSLIHARLAGVPLAHGLYTSFIGVFFYAMFSTSKDITVGPTAVLATLLGQLYSTSGTDIDPVVFQTALCFLVGLMQSIIGCLRLGLIMDLISIPVIRGFTSGAALTIMIGQVSGILGIPGVNTNSTAFMVLVQTINSLDKVRLDACFGVSAVCILYGMRVFLRLVSSKQSSCLSSALRCAQYGLNSGVIIISTIIAYLLYKNTPAKVSFF